MVNPCGATLGGGPPETSASATLNAVSEDGSKIFFTNPFPWRAASSESGCKAPAELYMRVNNGEPIEVSAPESGVSLKAAEIEPVRYNYATSDGSKVFFNTETPLTADETTQEKGENKLFEYDTEAPEGERLKLSPAACRRSLELACTKGTAFTFSEDGSIVYVEPPIGGGERLKSTVSIRAPVNGPSSRPHSKRAILRNRRTRHQRGFLSLYQSRRMQDPGEPNLAVFSTTSCTVTKRLAEASCV